MFQAPGVAKIKTHVLCSITFFQKSCSSVQCMMTSVCRQVVVIKHSGSYSHIPWWYCHYVIVGRHQNSKEPNSCQQRHPSLQIMEIYVLPLTTVLLKYVGFKRKQKRFNKRAKILGQWKALDRTLRKCSIYW